MIEPIKYKITHVFQRYEGGQGGGTGWWAKQYSTTAKIFNSLHNSDPNQTNIHDGNDNGNDSIAVSLSHNVPKFSNVINKSPPIMNCTSNGLADRVPGQGPGMNVRNERSDRDRSGQSIYMNDNMTEPSGRLDARNYKNNNNPTLVVTPIPKGWQVNRKDISMPPTPTSKNMSVGYKTYEPMIPTQTQTHINDIDLKTKRGYYIW